MKIIGIAALCLVLAMIGLVALSRVMNAGVVRELREEPEGERAQKVMLLTLPSGKALPVNYLLRGETVYAGADFPWWRALRGDGGEVQVLIRGQTYRGYARAVEDEPALRAEIFAELRPSAPSFTGTLVEIALRE